MNTVQEMFGVNSKFTNCLQREKFVAGVECEVEAVRTYDNVPLQLFKVTQDGSLRNKHAPDGHGHEFISIPLPTTQLLSSFKELHASLTYYDEDPFSSRTSTHVHINCIPLKEAEVMNLLLLYALFEEFFFAMVKAERRDNIHCVPLSETCVSNLFSRPLPIVVKSWHKYAALNIRPLQEIGTVEFRHLHGTGDVEEFAAWVKLLENLWTLAQKETVNKVSLKSKEKIQEWFDFLFSHVPGVYQMRPVMFDLMKNNIIDVKFAFTV